MNSEERQLITGLFDRMRSTALGPKDHDAEALINQSVRQIPDSAYMLVQSVLVQEQALTEAARRIEDLEARVNELESQERSSPSPQSGGSFLGGLFGGGTRPQPPARGSVPSAGAGRPMAARANAGSAWGNAPGYQAGAAQQQPPAAQQGGGFMRSAMTTAAGVAGGMLAANAISSMLGGQDGKAEAATPQAEASNAASGGEEASAFDADAYDNQNVQDASYQDDDGGWGDAGGDDLDI